MTKDRRLDGARQLAAAVLHRAYMDLQTKTYRHSALYFITSPRARRWFRWWCELAGVDPDEALRRFRHSAERRDTA